jgi:hypothetical protein
MQIPTLDAKTARRLSAMRETPHSALPIAWQLGLIGSPT